MRVDYDFKNGLLEEIKKNNDFSGCEKIKEYIRAYQVLNDERKKNLLKFIIYKLSSQLNNKEIREFDCDVSKEVNVIFKSAYTWLHNYEIVKQKSSIMKYELICNDRCFRGDTMTSALTPLKRYFELKGIDNRVYNGSSFEDFILDNINKITISKDVSNFLFNVHTIGNFIPVPMGFNIGRSNYGKWDSWDLTLTQIYLWYQDNKRIDERTNNRALEILFSNSKNKKESVAYCVEWLKMFSSWKEFVKSNYLKSFLDARGKPILFFKNHSLKNPLPQTIAESETFFRNVNNCITRRSLEISKALGNNISIKDNVKEFKIYQKAKDLISAKVFSESNEKFIESLKENPIEKMDTILLFLTKWIPIIYAVVLLILYIIMKDNETGLFEYGREPVHLYENYYFLFSILIGLVIAFFVSYNKALSSSTWKLKKILKFISYIGCLGFCTFIAVDMLDSYTNFIARIFSTIGSIIGNSSSLTIYNILFLFFQMVFFVEIICILISAMCALLLENVREVLFAVILRIGEVFLLFIILMIGTLLIDYWMLALVLGILAVGFVVISMFSSPYDDGMLKIVNNNNEVIGKIKKEDILKNDK